MPGISSGRRFLVRTSMAARSRRGVLSQPVVTVAFSLLSILPVHALGTRDADIPQTGPTLTVTTSADHTDGVCGSSDCTLREAIDAANALADPQTIVFTVGPANQQITLGSTLPQITDSLTIHGSPEEKITLNGNNTVRILDNYSGLTLENLTLKNGRAEIGGAVMTYSATNNQLAFNATNCTFLNNVATGGPVFTADGGAVSAYSDYLAVIIVILNGCTFSGNSATNGGAINLMSLSDGVVTASISGCTFNGNNAQFGGGLYLLKSVSSTTATVLNSTFSANTGKEGGGIYLAEGSISLDSVTFFGNSAIAGGGLSSYAPASSLQLRNTLWAANTASISPSTGSMYLADENAPTQGYNLFSDAPLTANSTGDQKGLGSALASTLGPLADNGGSTRTHALIAGSPARHAGSTNLAVDQRGQARPQGAADDAGAYEAVAGSAPMISAIENTEIQEDGDSAQLPFTVGDVDVPAGSLTVTGGSSNTALVPVADIEFGGSGANRTVRLHPADNQFGNVTITVTVSNGTQSASTSFEVEVMAVDDAPFMSAISDVSIASGSSTGDIPFILSDIDTDLSEINLFGYSSNNDVISIDNIEIGGEGANRTVKVTSLPGVTGTTTITIHAVGGGSEAFRSFGVTVAAAPAITSFTPGSGLVGASVQITGTAFTGANQVKFNGTAASFTVDSATQITATVPAGATTGTISVTTPGGTATSAASFTVLTTAPSDTTPPNVAVTTPANGAFVK